MESIPHEVYTAEQVRAMDRATIDGGIDGYTLMCRAAAAAVATLKRHWPNCEDVLIFAGAGNNGGDGYVVGRLAMAAGLGVRLVGLVAPDRLTGDAARAARDFLGNGGGVMPWHAAGVEVTAQTVIVDGLLGTGLDRPVAGEFAEAVKFVGSAGCPVMALDIPSGLHADTGHCLGVTVPAHVTVTFVGLKQGLFLGDAANYCGQLEFAGLGVPDEVYAQHAPTLIRLRLGDLAAALPPRVRSSHKGSHGSLLIVGGGPGMPGAVRLAAEAALRVGAGLVRVATHPDNVSAVTVGRPEVICYGVTEPDQLNGLLGSSHAVALGPGLGLSDWAQGLWRRVLAAGYPTVIDADGLNLLAAENVRSAQAPRILTPHPGEAARLLRVATREVQADRLDALNKLSQDYDATVVLKGANTLVKSPSSDPGCVCDRGNPGMASAGMGDVLTGVIAGLLVQLDDPGLAAQIGVLLHALAGDAAAADGERGTLAADLMPYLRQWANP